MEKDKENKGVKVTDSSKKNIERRCGKEREVGVSYLYSSPVFLSRNSVSRTINRLLSQCLSQYTLLFASVRLTVMESFGLMDASGEGFYLLLPLYLCLHPLTAQMSAWTFSIASKHGDWGYGQCKCAIWHIESKMDRAGGNLQEEQSFTLHCLSRSIKMANNHIRDPLWWKWFF